MMDDTFDTITAFMEIVRHSDLYAPLHAVVLDGTGVYLDDDGCYRHHGVVDTETFWSAGLRIGRNHSPALLFDLYFGGSLDLRCNPGLVADVWSDTEFPTGSVEWELMWRAAFEAAGYTHDGESASRPAESITLYRGCHHERRLGMSWTSNPVVAQWFADRDLGYGQGNVYVHHAQPDELLAFIGTEIGRGADEYVLDPLCLDDGNVARSLMR